MTQYHLIPNSSMLDSISWNNGILAVNFKNGKQYDYKDVPYSVFIEFKNAPSSGSFFNDKIKGTYERNNAN